MGCGYNVEVWLVGVVVRRYIDILIIMITFPNSTCISSFFGSSIPIFFILTRDERDFSIDAIHYKCWNISR